MSKAFLDVLHARQPKLVYISPAVCEYIFSGSGFSSLLLDENWNDDPVSGARIILFGSGGDHRLAWDPVDGAVCYTIYQADDPNNPLGTYHVVQDCWPDTTWTPPDWEPPVCVDPLNCPTTNQCYTIQAITDAGLGAMSLPICLTPPDDCPTCSGGNNSVEQCFTNATGFQTFRVDNPATFTPSLTNPQPVVSFELTSGSLPPGMTLNATTGTISGTPTTLGSYPLQLRVNYEGGLGCTQLVYLEVVDCILTENDLPQGWIDGPYTLTFEAFTGGSGGTWDIVSGALPGGLSLDANTGELSGTPSESGIFTFGISYTDGDDSCIKEFTLEILPACMTPLTLAAASEGDVISEQFVASIPLPGQTFSISAGSLPPSLSLNGAGLLSGTLDTGSPGSSGTWNFTVRLTNADLSFCDQDYSLLVVDEASPDCPTWDNLGAPALTQEIDLFGTGGHTTPAGSGASKTFTAYADYAPGSGAWSFRQWQALLNIETAAACNCQLRVEISGSAHPDYRLISSAEVELSVNSFIVAESSADVTQCPSDETKYFTLSPGSNAIMVEVKTSCIAGTSAPDTAFTVKYTVSVVP